MSDTRENPPAGRRLESLLRGELRRARRAHWLAALGPALVLSACALLIVALVLRFATPATPAGGRVLALIAWLAVLAPLAAAFLWPWRRLPGVRQLLREAEGRAETREILETATDVAEGRLAGKGYSEPLMDAVLAQAAARVGEGLPAPEQGPWPRRARRALLVLVPLTLLLAILPARGGIRPFALLAAPGNADHYAERAWLELLPGDVELLAGSPLRLELREQGLPWRFPGELKLEIDETGDLFNVAALQRDGESWTHIREAVHQGFAYRARRGRAESPVYRVSVFHPPLLDSLRITATPPTYTGLPERELGLHSGELRLPVDSRLALEGVSSSALAAAWLRIEGASLDSLALAVLGRQLAGALVVDENLRLSMRLEDMRGTVTDTPTLLGVTALPDRAPAVEILAPGPDEDLSRDLLETLELAATDDYGIAHLRLIAVKRGETDTLNARIPLGEDAGQSRIALRHLWDLGESWDLFPGDTVEYWLVVTDNHPTEPRWGKSRVQRLRVPSIAEIYAEIEKDDAERGDTLEEMITEGERMQEDLRRLEEELRADPELDWEREEELRKAFENMEQLSEQLQEMSKSLGDRSEALAENEMLREEMAEKLESIQELMDELRDTEAGELLRRFQELLAEMDPETLPEELAELRMDHEEIMEQLERTEALLEQLMRDQKMDALMRQVDEMLERQEELRADTENLQETDEATEGEQSEQGEEEGEQAEDAEGEQPEGNPEAMEELAELQEKLAEEAERLQEEIEKTAEELAEDFPEQSEQMQQQETPSDPMRDAAEQMEQNDEDASESQQDASQQLLKLYWRLMQAQQGMSAQMDMEAMAALDGVTRQTLELSLREEDHQAEMTRRFRSGRRPERMREAARQQMGLYQSMERVREELAEAGRKTFAVSREAMRSSARALEAMQTSVAELESGSHVVGIQAAGRSVMEINVTVIELLHGVQSQGQGGGSCPNPGQGMQDMLKRQEQLNRDSRGQAQKQGPGGLSMEQRSQMQRLRAEQEAIREGVQDTMGGEEGTLGRLDQIVEEMKEIEKELEGGRISDETLRRQEKVFERMLDAQRSVHRRDFKRERQGESADELAPLLPGELDADDPLAKLREEIRRGQGEAAPPEYEELIQEYYRSLLERQGGSDALNTRAALLSLLIIVLPAVAAAQIQSQPADSGSVRFEVQSPESSGPHATPGRLPGTPPIRPLERQGQSLSLARQLLQIQQLLKRNPENARQRLEALALQHPGHPQLRLLLGEAYRLSGRLAESERVLRGLSEEYPESTGYLGELARTLLRAGKEEEAMALLAKLYAGDPPRAGRFEEAAAMLLGVSRIRLAEDVYYEGLNALPRSDERGRLRLVRRLFELHALEDDPVSILTLLARREPEFEDPNLKHRLLNYAEQFLAESEHPERTLVLADSLAAAPGAVHLSEVLREIYLALGDHARFAEQVLRAPMAAQRRPDWLHDEGLRCLEEGRGDTGARRSAAAELFEAGLAAEELDPTLRSKLRFQLARIRLDQDAELRLRGERPDADSIAELRGLLAGLREENPGSFWAMRSLSEELRFLRERERAAATADALLRAWLLEPERARGPEIEAALELELGENLLVAGRFDEARRHYGEILAARRNRNAAGWASFRLAQLLAIGGEKQAAQDSLAALAKAEPAGALANDALDIALLLAESAAWPETVREFLDSSLELEFAGDLPGAARRLLAFALEFPEDPASPALLYRAGQLYLRALMGAQAMESWLLLADKHPEDFRAPQSLEQAARLADRLGERARALELLTRILQEHPRFPLRPGLRDLQERLEEDA